MRKNQGDKWRMYNVVITVMDNHHSVWESDVPFTTSYNRLKAYVAQIGEEAFIQTTNRSGVTRVKEGKKKALLELTYFVVNQMQSYAAATDNEELSLQVDYTFTDLRLQRDASLIGTSQMVLGAMEEHLAALAPYRITAATVTEMEEAIAAFSGIVSEPKVALTQKKRATDSLKTLFADVDKLLKSQCDRNIQVYKTVAPDFYSEYKLARAVVRTRHTKLALKGSVFAETTGKPLAKAVVTLKRQSPTGYSVKEKAVTRKTSEKGNFQVKNMAEGSYKITVTLETFVTVAEKIFIRSGNTAVFRAGMEGEGASAKNG